MRMAMRSLASRFDSGSSNRNTFGCRTMARPMATRWRWPPESWRGLRSSSGPISRICAASFTRVLISVFGHAAVAQAVGHVVVDGHVRIERVVLEHHRDVAIRRLDVVDDAAADIDLAGGHRLEAGDHPQQRGLAAAGRADQHAELPVADVEVDALDGVDAARVGLAHIAAA